MCRARQVLLCKPKWLMCIKRPTQCSVYNQWHVQLKIKSLSKKMWRCHICIFPANTVVYCWALTPSHQNPPPIGNQRSQWAVPDLCQCPITEEDRRQTHIQIKTHTYAHPATQREMERREGEKKTKDSHIHSNIKKNRQV